MNTLMTSLNNWRLRRKSTARRVNLAVPVPTTSTIAPPSSCMSVTAPGREYGTGYSDEAVEAMAAEDASSQVHDKSTWGKNASHAFVPEMINKAHLANVSGNGKLFRAIVDQVHKALELMKNGVKLAIEDALDAIDAETAAALDKVDIRNRMKKAGHSEPSPRSTAWFVASMAALVVGDWTLIAVAFQLLGLSDQLLLGFLPFSDETHIAASTSVLVMLVLTHHAGQPIASLLHAAKQHDGPEAKFRELLTFNHRLELLKSVGYLVSAAMVAVGVCVIRAHFLGSQDLNSEFIPFLAVQFGFLVAALALSISYYHPFRADLSAASKRSKGKQKHTDECLEICKEWVGAYNGNVNLTNQLLADAGHNVIASSRDADRQKEMYSRREQLSQPEPTTSDLFSTTVADAEAFGSEKDRIKEIVGITDLPTFERMDMDEVHAARAKSRKRIDTHRDTPVVITDDPPPSEEQAEDDEGTETRTIEVSKPPDTAVKTNGGSRT